MQTMDGERSAYSAFIVDVTHGTRRSVAIGEYSPRSLFVKDRDQRLAPTEIKGLLVVDDPLLLRRAFDEGFPAIAVSDLVFLARSPSSARRYAEAIERSARNATDREQARDAEWQLFLSEL